MSEIGYYRYKIQTVSDGGNIVTFKVGGVDAKTCTVITQDICQSIYKAKRVLKYLNRDGQYRFYAFSTYYEEVERPKEIGMIGQIITSIKTSKASQKSVGYKSERIINLVSETIPTVELEHLRDIFTSPRVYLYIGGGTDTDVDWLQVTVKADKSIRKEAKAKYSQLSFEVLLPETYAITML